MICRELMWRLLLVLTALSVAILAACPPPISDTGSLSLTIRSNMANARIIQPALPMIIDTYCVRGDGHGGASFRQDDVTASTFRRDALAVGDWTMTVEALNSVSTVIASDRQTITILAGQMTNASMTVVPFYGNGTLSLGVTSPAGSLDAASVIATLTPLQGDPEPLAFSVGPSSATYSGQWPAGYYRLGLTLMDGSVVAWGRVEAVRMLADETASAAFAYQTAGYANISIDADLEDPIAVTLSGAPSTIDALGRMTVSASCSEAPDSYQWYVNGSALKGETSSSTTVEGSALLPGLYTLDVLVVKGHRLGSSGVTFTVLGSGLEGVVVDGRGGSPVAGATVTCGSRSTSSDAEGQFMLLDLPPGVYDVSVSKSGRAGSKVQAVSIAQDRMTRVEIVEPQFDHASSVVTPPTITASGLTPGQSCDGQVAVRIELARGSCPVDYSFQPTICVGIGATTDGAGDYVGYYDELGFTRDTTAYPPGELTVRIVAYDNNNNRSELNVPVRVVGGSGLLPSEIPQCSVVACNFGRSLRLLRGETLSLPFGTAGLPGRDGGRRRCGRA